MKSSAAIKSPKGKAKIKKVFKEYGKGDLHSGSKKGPIVSSQKQAIGIALSEARKKAK
jgi:hypothetical protein